MSGSNLFNLGSDGGSPRSSGFGNVDSPNPYAAQMGTPPPKRSLLWLWILLGVAGVLVLICCGCMGLAYFGGGKAMNATMDLVGREIRPSLEADPVIQEHIGEIQSLSGDFGATIQESQKSGNQGEMVFNIRGTKGEGVVIGKPDQEAKRLEDGRLRMSTGEEFPLTVPAN